MNIDAFNLRLRRRPASEALDLGAAMVHRWRRQVLFAWCALYWPIGLALAALLWSPLGGWAWFILWWLKPWFDRCLLNFFSRAVFGEEPTARECVMAALRATVTASLWADLTLRRLSMSRSFSMPVAVLEGQGRAGRSRRVAALRRDVSGSVHGLLALCSVLEMLVQLTIITLVVLFLPGGILVPHISEVGLAGLFGDVSRPAVLLGGMLTWMAAETLVEPYYVAAGFSLYLNRRGDLEGWDLEIAFRRMGERLRQSAPRDAASLARNAGALVALVLASAWPHGEVRAAGPTTASPVVTQASPRVPSPQQPAARETVMAPRDGQIEGLDKSKKTLQDELAGPAYGRDQARVVWLPRKVDNPTKQKSSGFNLNWLRMLGTLGGALQLLFRAVVGALIVVLIYLLVRWLAGQSRWPSFKLRERPSFVGGVDVRPESLPADPAAVALQLARAGDGRAALGLLYRATLVALIDRAHVPLTSGDTEGRCMARAEPKVPASANDYLRRLVAAWRATAYGHLSTPIQELEALCQAFPDQFGADASWTKEAGA